MIVETRNSLFDYLLISNIYLINYNTYLLSSKIKINSIEQVELNLTMLWSLNAQCLMNFLTCVKSYNYYTLNWCLTLVILIFIRTCFD
jgi:hypothetical protein